MFNVVSDSSHKSYNSVNKVILQLFFWRIIISVRVHPTFPMRSTNLLFFSNHIIYKSRPVPGSTIAWTYSKSYYETLMSEFTHIFWTAQFDYPTDFKKIWINSWQGWNVLSRSRCKIRAWLVKRVNLLWVFLYSSAFANWWQHQSQWSMCMQGDGWLFSVSWLQEQTIVSTTMWITCDDVILPW